MLLPWSARPPAPSAVLSSARLGLATLVGAALGLTACAGGSREIPALPLDSALAQHLAAPTSACGSTAGELSAQNEAYQSLLSDRRSALAVEAQALERRESGGGWTLLLAQARFARGDLEGASVAARESVGTWPACTPAWMIEGRIRDLRGEVAAAVAAYRLALATPAEGAPRGARKSWRHAWRS